MDSQRTKRPNEKTTLLFNLFHASSDEFEPFRQQTTQKVEISLRKKLPGNAALKKKKLSRVLLKDNAPSF